VSFVPIVLLLAFAFALFAERMGFWSNEPALEAPDDTLNFEGDDDAFDHYGDEDAGMEIADEIEEWELEDSNIADEHLTEYIETFISFSLEDELHIPNDEREESETNWTLGQFEYLNLSHSSYAYTESQGKAHYILALVIGTQQYSKFEEEQTDDFPILICVAYEIEHGTCERRLTELLLAVLLFNCIISTVQLIRECFISTISTLATRVNNCKIVSCRSMMSTLSVLLSVMVMKMI